MATKIEQIIETLKHDQTNLFCDGAFAYFINNQITVDELADILKSENIELPKSFFDLDICDQKRYRQWWKTTVYYEDKKFIQDTRVIFNAPYFYDLAEHARKTISFTEKLVKYVYDLTDINLLFFGMSYIKIRNTKLSRYSKLMKFAEDKKINDLYSLVIELCGKKILNQEMLELRNLLTEKLKDESFIGIDLNDPFTKLCLYIESLLYSLPRKEANTLKLKFLILNKGHLRDIDYFDSDKPSRVLLKDYESYFSSYTINQLIKYAQMNPKLFDGSKPNGYLAFYYSFVEGKQ